MLRSFFNCFSDRRAEVDLYIKINLPSDVKYKYIIHTHFKVSP